MKDLIIVGASGFGREVLQWVKDINNANPTWNVLGFLDDNLNALDTYECDYKVIATIEDYSPKAGDNFVIALADPALKEQKIRLLESKGAKFVSIIHPESRIGDFNKIGKGVVIYPGARITVNATIGNFVVLLDLTTIGHDAVVGDYSTICGGCGINGHVNVGPRVFIGSHVTTAPSVKIGEGAYVGTGSAVVTNIKAGYRVFGNPARKIML